LAKHFAGMTLHPPVRPSWTFAGVLQPIRREAGGRVRWGCQDQGYPGLWTPPPWTYAR
jgi:hypothetical protein